MIAAGSSISVSATRQQRSVDLHSLLRLWHSAADRLLSTQSVWIDAQRRSGAAGGVASDGAFQNFGENVPGAGQEDLVKRGRV